MVFRFDDISSRYIGNVAEREGAPSSAQHRHLHPRRAQRGDGVLQRRRRGGANLDRHQRFSGYLLRFRMRFRHTGGGSPRVGAQDAPVIRRHHPGNDRHRQRAHQVRQ